MGWTGKNCSVNCGCNNHSKCTEGIGKCDQCQDWTEGELCEHCVIGSYGNATSLIGCIPCECHNHGNEQKGFCDQHTGQCYCQDNTEGMNCEICSRDYYGDPSTGQCYLQCGSRSILKNIKKQGIGSYQSSAETKECLWMVKLDGEMEKGSLIQLEIERTDMNVSCNNNAVWIFSSLPEFAGNAPQKQLTNIICNENNYPWIVEESKTGQMTIYFKQGARGQGFNAMLSIFNCKLGTCMHPYVCDSSERCSCPPGRTGIECSTFICPGNCSFALKQGICDEGYGRCLCNEGFGGSDCSKVMKTNDILVQELFNTELISETFEHLRKTLPRFGHTLVVDRRGSLWMFGGYSLSHGALNDIRQFDSKNNTWMQVTVDSTPDAKMPKGRYFHASEILLAKQIIYTYGGLNFNSKNKSLQFLGDFWQFSLQEQRWKEVEIEENSTIPLPLAGHTLTLMKNGDKESLILIGGCSNTTSDDKYGFWEYNLNKKWIKLNTSGSIPNGIFGHSTVYQNMVLYVFGGYQMVDSRMQISNKLFAFSYDKMLWTELPLFNQLNRLEDYLPRARFLHSAVSTPQFMLIYGGQTHPHNSSDILNAYVYKCNSWIRLTENVDILGKYPALTYAQAIALDVDSESNFYVAGGLDGPSYRITKINMPSDICQLWSSSKYLCRLNRGCTFCGVNNADGGKETYCVSNGQDEVCEKYHTYNEGAACDDKWIAERNCSSFSTCGACLSQWPQEKTPSCQWCDGESSCGDEKKCSVVGTVECDKEEGCGGNKTNDTQTDAQCSANSCLAFDCDNCKTKPNCDWVKVDNKHKCMTTQAIEKKKLEALTECPAKCDVYKDCHQCLSALSTEGGWDSCLWSTRLGKCMSPSYQPLFCSGGVCGLVLSPEENEQCPESCETNHQCSKCLQTVHCGWCSLNSGDGDGVCVEGSLERPIQHHNHPTDTCVFEYSTIRNISNTLVNSSFEWNYVKCPQENECLNEHHNCNSKSERCVDRPQGYECQCAEGYKTGFSNECIPVCEKGCIHGTCVEPNHCSCDFGYVGNNCSIQCLCNGHSDCGGPDRLDECLECKNNTMGNQCEKCENFFVGDPRDNRKCVSCTEYCNGHTDLCVEKLEDSYKNATRAELKMTLTEGPKADAICLYCANETDGNKCETCKPGSFRGTSTLTDGCRPCECQGHGDSCDPITGEKCNCSNNTESDNTCSAKLVKNSIYLCWMSQCSKCKETFSGHPKDGHQCYKHITIDSKFCLDALPLDECKTKPQPLKAGQTIFFVVQPRFLNVDIRIILDVTQGELDFFMSSNDDSFVVFTNQTNGLHEIFLDSK